MEINKTLANQIWTTRVSRVNAEKRLINKESFFQAINIYYSCLTIIFSILTLLNGNEKNGDEKLSLLTVHIITYCNFVFEWTKIFGTCSRV